MPKDRMSFNDLVKNQSRKCMSDIEPLSRNSSVKKKVGLSRETTGKSVKRSEYLDVLDVLRHPSLKTPPRYELCPIDPESECMRYDHTSDRKEFFFLGTSDKEESAKGKKDQSAHRSGISSHGRYSPLPFRRQSATASVKEKYFTDTPQVDRHSVSIRQPSSLVKREQRHKQGMNIGNKCPAVSYSLSA